VNPYKRKIDFRTSNDVSSVKTVISVQKTASDHFQNAGVRVVDAYDDGGIDWSVIPVSSPPLKKSEISACTVKTRERVGVEAKQHAGGNVPKQILVSTAPKKGQNNDPIDIFDIDGIDWGAIDSNGDCPGQKSTCGGGNSCGAITRSYNAHEVQIQEQKQINTVHRQVDHPMPSKAPPKVTHGPKIVRKIPITPTKALPCQQFNSPSSQKKHKVDQATKCQTLLSSLPGSAMKRGQLAITNTKLPADLVYTPDRIVPVDDGNRASLIKYAGVSAKLDNGWTLLNHQKIAVLKGLKMRRLVLAYDMGLGKTVIACVWARAFKNTFPSLKILLIAPVSLHKEWKKTAYTATGLNMENDTDDPLDMTISSWAKIPKIPSTSVEKFIVICDEAHSMQSMNSARTKDSLKLILEKRCVGCLLLTGTPMKNGKPSNLFPLLKAVRHPFGDDQKTFEVYFCAGQQKNYGKGVVWDASGSSNLPTLNAHIISHVIHMTKDECLKDLPAKERVYRDVPVSSRHELKYIAALNELAKAYDACQKDKDLNNEIVLGAFSKVRLVSSRAKIEATVALARSVLEKEPAIVIFSFFVDIAKVIQKKLQDSGWEGELLTGQTPPAKRQECVDRFQEGTSCVFVCTFGAGGVGLTLTAACTIILHDRPWTPGDALQAEDRVRRIGQTKKVTSIWMRAFAVDKQIDVLIEQKQKKSKSVVDKQQTSSSRGDCQDAPKLSISELVRSLIPKDHDSLRGLQTGG